MVEETDIMNIRNDQLKQRQKEEFEEESDEETGGSSGSDFYGGTETLWGTSSQYGAFQCDGKWIRNCHVMVGRRVISCADVKIEKSGTYYAKVTHTDSSESLEVTTDGSGNTDEVTYIPLFVTTNGEVTNDYRGMPCIPLRE